ncbi:hypothetical protein FKM82_001102 [Ascaphus truei]
MKLLHGTSFMVVLATNCFQVTPTRSLTFPQTSPRFTILCSAQINHQGVKFEVQEEENIVYTGRQSRAPSMGQSRQIYAKNLRVVGNRLLTAEMRDSPG